MKLPISLLYLFLLFLPPRLMAQEIPEKYRIDPETFSLENDSLRTLYWNGKSCNRPDLAPACLAALSHYPELRGLRIDFVYKGLNETARVRPRVGSFFRKRANRRYRIALNDNCDIRKGLVLDAFSFNALVGVLGHELGHILDYSQKSNCRILRNGISYVFSRRFHRRLERGSDLIALDHGLGWQLYEARDYVINHSNAPEKVKKDLLRFYYTPKEILEYLTLTQIQMNP